MKLEEFSKKYNRWWLGLSLMSLSYLMGLISNNITYLKLLPAILLIVLSLIAYKLEKIRGN